MITVTDAVKMFCAGMLPLPVGILFHVLLMYLPLGPLMLLVEFALVAVWFYLAFRMSKLGKRPVIQAFLLSAFGLLMLALALYQEFVLGRYWLNAIGFGSQMYFLPFVTLATLILNLFMDVVRPWPVYIVIWTGLFLTGWLGCLLKRRKGVST